MTDVTIKEYKSIDHMTITTVHLVKYSGVFDCPGKPLHGRMFYHAVETEMIDWEPGETTSLFYLSDEDKTFKTLKRLIKHYNK